ncbi:MAG TPA: hypothetical protein VFT64_04315 [Rickettsiales bacterium]|nr:hypothetical protein [Rickettsiales bacterium]
MQKESEHKHDRSIAELERALGRKTLENDILCEVIEKKDKQTDLATAIVAEEGGQWERGSRIYQTLK